MNGMLNKVSFAIACASLVASSTSALAASPPSLAPTASTMAANPWATLSMMSSGYAAQGYEDRDRVGSPPLLPLLVILATIAVGLWIALDDDDDDGSIRIEPISPN